MNTHNNMSEQITVVIADDHPVVCKGIATYLDAQSDIHVVGEVASGDDVVDQIQENRPDVLLLDLNMPGPRPTELAQRVLKTHNPPKIVVLSAHGDPEYVLAMMRAGAVGYVLKEEDLPKIAEAIRAAMTSETWLSEDLAAGLIRSVIHSAKPTPKDDLSKRELQILRAMAHGLSNPRIATRLRIKEGTVKNHISNIYAKLGLSNRAEAVAWAWENGIVAQATIQ